MLREGEGTTLIYESYRCRWMFIICVIVRGIVVRMACYVNMKPGISAHHDGDDATLNRIEMNDMAHATDGW